MIKENLYQAERFYQKLRPLLLEDESAFFGADESLRVEAIASSPELTAEQVETLSSLFNKEDKVVVTCPSALLRYLPKPEIFKNLCLNVKVDEELNIEDIKRKLKAAGYEQVSHVDHPLTFASRGGIVDVYSINYDKPIRIEFFDTVVESIRFFDILSQRTESTIDEVNIVPASTVLFMEEDIKELEGILNKELEKANDEILSENIRSDFNLIENNIVDKSFYPYLCLLSNVGSLIDYMHDPLIIISDEERINEAEKKLHIDTIQYVQDMHSEKKLLNKYDLWIDYRRLIADNSTIRFIPFGDNISGIEEIFLPNESLNEKVNIISKDERSIVVLEEKECARFISACIEEEIEYSLFDGSLIKEGINIIIDDLVQGFELIDKDIKVFTAKEIFEIRYHKSRFEKKFRNAEIIHDYTELEKGDYVVHATYGVGQYLGIITKKVNGAIKDYLEIVYRGNNKLMVPLEQFRLVRKFISREGVVPKLNKIGTNEWQKTKERIQNSVENVAERLIELYSARENNIGYAFSKDNELAEKFEAGFPHDLTIDQANAVKEIKKDMESSKPMDRLICGDVGFGKTEISVIASFKAISDNKQVAMLCPTTILAEQHYKTYSQRYKDYPVRIEVLNRFVSYKKQKEILKDLEEGKIDILVGTHRVLSKDVKFKDLGLLIIDEEQRFGVLQKERIKEIKQGVDVLALSATPIPRTLQMSLVGVRSLSQLETPPQNRYSVQTYVVEKDRGLIKDAIEKELARKGQVFYLYNNTTDIYGIARSLQKDIPEAKIGIVHGKMDREEIEDVMYSFTKHDIDVLVCTTIMENGIDIPNANTIIVDRAHTFGLSQLYQIKGRVGRSDRVAYAYLLIPERKQLTEIEEKRLQAIKEFARLGSGYKIAMRDLTIRGAGDLLGPEQSGFIDTVGIDMYIEMLEEAIAAKQNGEIKKEEEPKKSNIADSGYIPKSFAPDDFDKLDMYHKIAQIITLDDLSKYKEDIIDQFGKLPKEVQKVFEKRELDLYLMEKHVEEYKEYPNRGEITFTQEYSDIADGIKLFEEFAKLNRDIAIRYTNKKIIVILPEKIKNIDMIIKVIKITKEATK